MAILWFARGDRGRAFCGPLLTAATGTHCRQVLTFDELFGNPVTPNMSVNKRVFLISEHDLEQHEQPAVKQLRRYLLRNDGEVAAAVAQSLLGYIF